MSDTLSILMLARDLIPSANHWCAHAFEETRENGMAYCARGAIYRAIGAKSYNAMSDTDEPYCKELAKEIPEHDSGIDQYIANGALCPNDKSKEGVVNEYKARGAVAIYNNTHKYEDVAALFDRAIARLKRERTISDLLSNRVNLPELEVV